MKKILFATTALVAFAGGASADVMGSGPGTVDISGRAEIGVVGGSAYGDVSQFHTDIDIDFVFSGEADNGLTFGATLDLDEVPSGMPETDDYGVGYFIAYGGARLDMGDVDGGFDWALQEVNLVGGSINDAETVHPGFNGNAGLDGTYDGQIAAFSYSFGDFAFAVSTEIDDTGTLDPVWGVGAKYSGDLGGVTLGVGLGYQSTDSLNTFDEVIGMSIDAGFAGGFSAAVNYSEKSGAAVATESHTAVGVGYEMNALGIGLNYGMFDDYLGVAGDEANGFGLAVNYDLGGGLVVQFGAGVGEMKIGGVTTDYDNYSLGLAMTF